MISLLQGPVFLFGGRVLAENADHLPAEELQSRLGREGVCFDGVLPQNPGAGTMARHIVDAHHCERGDGLLHLKFDKLTSNDVAYVGVLQTAIACGLQKLPVPLAITNCHNSLCAVGGTISEDDHLFGLTAMQKFGGIYVPRHTAVMHQYMREAQAVAGAMILGTDSHTRYGALGTMAVGEGGPEMVKQLLGRTYDFVWPGVVAIYLKGRPRPGVGPHDVALALVKAVFPSGFVKNKAVEFVGPGVENLSAEFRLGIDVMTTETSCWSSIWRTDETIRGYYQTHGREEAFHRLNPDDAARYDGAVVVDLDTVEPMIALPFHPSNAWTIAEFNENAGDLLRGVEREAGKKMDNPNLRLNLTDKLRDGRFFVDQGVIAGCAGGNFENLVAAAQILDGGSTGCGAFALSVYPSSQPVNEALMAGGWMEKLVNAGVVNYPCFCGPCFGAGETPANGGFSIRHTTRNFPNREGSKPDQNQIAAVALMDARSIAATAANGGALTSAFACADRLGPHEQYRFDGAVYAKRVYSGFGHPLPETVLRYGPNIKQWPHIEPLPEDQLLYVASVIRDSVTTTDELVPSGETSALRSDPLKLAEYTLQRKDPHYVANAKKAKGLEQRRLAVLSGAVDGELDALLRRFGTDAGRSGIGSLLCAFRPGEGSAREQAASSQKMLGGEANVALEYATKRYRANLTNWGMMPWIVSAEDFERFRVGQWLFVPDLRKQLAAGAAEMKGRLLGDGVDVSVTLRLPCMNGEERAIIRAGCLINYYRERA